MKNNNEFVEVRKKYHSHTKHTTPKVGLGLPNGEFLFYKPTLELLNLDFDNQGLMFSINAQLKQARITIEPKQHDNYHLTGTKRSYSRFTSKPLGITFSDAFGLEMNSKHFFKVEKKENGVLLMTLID